MMAEALSRNPPITHNGSTVTVEVLLSNRPSITFTLAAEVDFNTILEEDIRIIVLPIMNVTSTYTQHPMDPHPETFDPHEDKRGAGKIAMAGSSLTGSIRMQLQSAGTSLEKNDADLFGDGDQSPITNLEDQHVYEELFSSGTLRQCADFNLRSVVLSVS
jgi:hypothetical protein